MESATIGVLQWMFTEAGCESSQEANPPRDMAAAAASWAIYGAAREWAQRENRPRSEEIAGMIAELVGPILNAASSESDTAPQVCSAALPPIGVGKNSRG
jgi:hypothetical protein